MLAAAGLRPGARSRLSSARARRDSGCGFFFVGGFIARPMLYAGKAACPRSPGTEAALRAPKQPTSPLGALTAWVASNPGRRPGAAWAGWRTIIDMRTQPNLGADAVLQRLPLVALYLTERCNSRCVTCDYWRHGRVDMNLESVQRLLPSLAQLRTRAVLISGGEPLLNPQWAEIAQLLRAQGLSTWLLTSGLSLAKHARRASQLFDAITVSMDGTNARTYAAIRGLDAFDKVCEGIRAAT